MDGDCRPPRTATFDYWLCRCQGFRVDSPEGRVGFVEEARFRSRVDRPDALAVRAGRVGRHLLIVPVDEVADIVPREERIVLRSAPPLKGRLRLPRLAAGRRRSRGGTDDVPLPGAARRLWQRLLSALKRGGRGGQPTATGKGYAAEMLAEARALLVRGWCRQEDALDEDGAPVDPSNPAARRWSVAGALLAVWEEWRGAGKPADLVSRDFAEAGLALRAAVGDIVAWNDAPERTHGEVLAAFDRAIELLRATAAWGSEPRSIRTVDPSGREGR
jgi:hypothetical protein